MPQTTALNNVSGSIFRPPDESVYWKTIFFIPYPKHMLFNGSFEHPKHMFKLMGKKINTILG